MSRQNVRRGALLLLILVLFGAVEIQAFSNTLVRPIVQQSSHYYYPGATPNQLRSPVAPGWRRHASIPSDTPFLSGSVFHENARSRLLPMKKKKSKVPATTFNLIKAIAGSGVLALPAGVAAVSSYKSSLIPATLIMTVLGAFSMYTFGLYGRLVNSSGAKSLGEAWEKQQGKATAWIPSVANLLFCFGASLSYSILLGDAFSALAQSAGIGLTTRHFWIVLLTSTVLWPLCNLKSLLALAPLSVFGVVAVLATTLFLGWRCPLVNPTSPYVLGTFDTFYRGWLSPASLVLGGMAASAYLGHFSAPGFYHSLQEEENDGSGEVAAVVDPNVKKEKQLADYGKVTVGGFLGATVINCLVMAFGYLTFGADSKGVILNNFSTMDAGASICRLLMAVCVTGGFPFLISACRGEVLELWKLLPLGPAGSKKVANRRFEQRITATLLGLVTAGALVMQDAGFVIGFVGSVMGSLVAYVFPSFLFLKKSESDQPLSRRLRLERLLCRFLIGFGLSATVMGGTVSVLNTYFPHMLH